ncbi:DNA ligase [Vibrio orientalis CIP 102891 = ATCC 33934]|uniref:DNA ligase n=1 Tax=Vibrio orientalis CIP 102891 = ATCC 33934 TaxID=675816 RepID=C9QKR7_VIBOR|nr:DNA ligase [Vibrio orientalis]EEX92402.1 ATP-dependent DNA ligase [Vibrio orientalis CIP 102891 = ATCC 33934]EGU48961.1 DNA ligase [Vibrio orientalis CIP 102891 = ATCC 33934]
MELRLSAVAVGLMLSAMANATTHNDSTSFMPVMLATSYHSDIIVDEYWQSEKLDGIRAIWDGKQLKTRNGHPIHAPHWFTEPLPHHALEGELWAGRGNFSLVQQTVLDKTPSDSAWKRIEYMLFDIPYSAGDYQKRYFGLVHLVNSLNVDHLKYVEHTPIASQEELISYLDSVDSSKGEGVMLRKITSRYQAGRSSDLLKLKKHQDAEALVIGYKVGNGKYKGMMGALLVQIDSGLQFYIGSGFSDELRKNPPAIGTKVNYRYNGYTSNGVPKFARYVRERTQ